MQLQITIGAKISIVCMFTRIYLIGPLSALGAALHNGFAKNNYLKCRKRVEYAFLYLRSSSLVISGLIPFFSAK